MRALVVACGDTPLLFEFRKQALDPVALAVENLVMVERLFSASAGRDARLDAPGFQFRAKPGAVLATTGDQVSGWRKGVGHEASTIVVTHPAFP